MPLIFGVRQVVDPKVCVICWVAVCETDCKENRHWRGKGPVWARIVHG
jgi:hypothetical protein